VDPGAGHLNLVTAYAYDAKGRAVSTTDAKGVVTQTTFDAKGQVTSVVVDPGSGHLNLATTYSYDARGKKLTVTEGAGSANPRVTQYAYDKLGRLVSERIDPNGINATTSYLYDANGNVARKTDALGNVTHYAYDGDDRLVYTVDALGGVTRNEYDPEGRVVRYTAYATPIALAGLADVASAADVAARITGSPQDETKGYVYDGDGREVFCVDALGGVTRKIYDDNGNVVRSVQFAVPIPLTTALTRGAVNGALAPSLPLDRVTRTVYDAANRAVYVIDSGNYVKETQYDALGQIVKTVQHTTPISVSGIPTIAEVQAALAPAVSPLVEASSVPVQSVALNGATTSVAANAVQPYAYVASARSDAPAALSLTVQNTSETQSANVANYSWVRSGTTLVQTSGLSIVPGYISYGDNTPSRVSATIYRSDGSLYGTTSTDVGYEVDSYSDKLGYTDYWQGVDNWSGQVNLSSGPMPAGHYTVVLQAADDYATSGSYHGSYQDFDADGTWAYSNTINVTIGTVVQPTYVTWAASDQPAGTTASFKYRAAGGSGAYTNAAVSVSGTNLSVNLGAVAAGSYEYFVEYRDASGQLVKSAGGTLSSVLGQTTTTSAGVSTSVAGSSIGGYITAAETPTVDYVDATVRDVWGNVVSTARTYPGAESDYSGGVNLKLGAVLADGHYTVSISVHKKDGTVDNRAPFAYEVGATTKLQYTLAWSGSVQPANTTPVFMYRPSGSTYAWLAPAVTVSGGNDQVLIDWAAPGAYDYDVQYRDASGKTLQEATGTFSVAASGASSSTAAFQHRETMITWSK